MELPGPKEPEEELTCLQPVILISLLHEMVITLPPCSQLAMITLCYIMAIACAFAFLLFLTLVELYHDNTEQTEEHVTLIVTRNHKGNAVGMLSTITTNGGNLWNTDYVQSHVLVSPGLGDLPMCGDHGTLYAHSHMCLEPSVSFRDLSGGVCPNVGTQGWVFMVCTRSTSIKL